MTRTANPVAAILALAMVFTMWLPTVAVPSSSADAVALVQLA